MGRFVGRFVLGLASLLACAGAGLAQTPDAGEDCRAVVGEDFRLRGVVSGRSPLAYWVADGNGASEDMLVRYPGTGDGDHIGPLRTVNGKRLGWPGDLVRVGERVEGVDVAERRIYEVDLATGECLPITPALPALWQALQSLAYDPVGDRLFSFDEVEGQLISIEPGTGLVKRIDVPGLDRRHSVRSLAYDPALRVLFAMDSDAERLIVVEPDLGLVAGEMALALPPDTKVEELQFFAGELYGMLGYLEAGNLVAGQLLRINTRTGGISNVGERMEEVSPHALLVESVPERVTWRQVTGPAPADLEYSSTLDPSVRFSQPGAYVFELTVYVGGRKLRDRVSVQVEIRDCNGNGVDDGEEIARGTAFDRNENGVPDECELARGFTVRFVPGEDAGWVGLTVAPWSAGDAAPSPAARAWLTDSVLLAPRPAPFDGAVLADARDCRPFDPRALFPGLDAAGRGALDGSLVGFEVALGLWRRSPWRECAAGRWPAADFHLAFAP